MTVNIVYSSSDYYAQCMGVSIYSLLVNNQEIPEIRIYVLETGISEGNKRKINMIGKQFNRKVMFIEAQRQFDDYVKKFKFKYLRGSYNTYARVMLNAWFGDLDKVLLIDSDTLVVDSIKDLWDTDIENYLIGAVPEAAVYSAYNTYEDDKIVSNSNPYFNMGIVLCNLKYWREQRLDDLIEEKMNGYKTAFMIADQSILNYAVNDRIKRLHLKYNFYTAMHSVKYSTIKKVFSSLNIFSETEFFEARNNPVIIHFVGHPFERPWFDGSVSCYKNEYLLYRGKTPWKDEALMSIPRPKNIIFGFYDRFTYLLLKTNMVNITHHFRYIWAQKIKKLINQSR